LQNADDEFWIAVKSPVLLPVNVLMRSTDSHK
jgi:hypothetical protein